MGEVTLCKECLYLENKWEDWKEVFRCKAVPIPQTIDPVTGKVGYKHINDLGGVYYSDIQYIHCRKRNDGSCTYYVPKKGS